MPNFNVHPRACSAPFRARFTHKLYLAFRQQVSEPWAARAIDRDETFRRRKAFLDARPRYSGYLSATYFFDLICRHR